MRLVFDTATVVSPGAIQLQRELVWAVRETLPRESDLIVICASDSPTIGLGDSEEIRVSRPGGGWVGLWDWFNRRLPQIVRRHGGDVVYSLGGLLSKSLWRSCGTVTTVNNMLPFSRSLVRDYPLLSKNRIRLNILRRAYVWSVRRADALVLHSQYALNTISAFAGDISSKTHVVLTGIPRNMQFDPASPPPHPLGGSPYLFYFSAVYPYKNHLNLIEAYRRVCSTGVKPPVLIMAGLPVDTDYIASMEHSIRKGGLKDQVRYLGAIDEADIPAWLHHATVNVFPSACETNSVAQVEILALHGVMACSNRSSMTEVGSYAVELFDPHDPDSIAEVVSRLCGDPNRRNQLRTLAARRARELSWAACGEAIWIAAQCANREFSIRSSSSH